MINYDSRRNPGFGLHIPSASVAETVNKGIRFTNLHRTLTANKTAHNARMVELNASIGRSAQAIGFMVGKALNSIR